MQELMIYSKYYYKVLTSFKAMFTSTLGIYMLVPTIAVMAITNTQKAIVLLGVLFVLDFITGVAASWFEKLKKEKSNPELKKEALISSQKMRLSAVKAFTYCSSILSIYGIEKIFFIKSFKFENISNQNLTVTVIAVAFFCSIEFYSIFFENFKRMGFDLAMKFGKIFDSLKKLFTKVKSFDQT